LREQRHTIVLKRVTEEVTDGRKKQGVGMGYKTVSCWMTGKKKPAPELAKNIGSNVSNVVPSRPAREVRIENA